ncbi:hypothetical protein [Mesorhizobium retamae]|uniref:MotA/TolQ/ExbB proton channel domain-containing protein n=1 Tax=Mesorhizobium retamae TaxID=2912854 RepID=A0ABS9QI59_9HYPH|nr:hypothetical protein [Mesorhizobium sp. IRAMC:0171]MCG7507045.1 hypothetical protein [Mesorhizobium sp. IRAMC:0171]
MTVAKLFIVNFGGACVLVWAYMMGYLQRLVATDASHIGLLIVAVFAAGVVSTFLQARKVDKAAQKSHKYQRERAKEAIEIDSAHLSDLRKLLFIFGVLGNAIGLMIAFSAIKSGASAQEVSAGGAQFLAGVGTCFSATVAALSLACWTIVNIRILTTATDKLAPEYN